MRLARNWLKHVVYVDKGVIVVNKPPGLICQRRKIVDPDDDEIYLDELLNDLQRRLDLPNAPYPLHRLDKATTGALVLARNLAIARDLSQQFQQRTVRKTYLALVHARTHTLRADRGHIVRALAFTEGRVSLAQGDGKTARTDWEVVAESKSENTEASLLRLTLHTGLKHQLRVHLSQVLRAPIIGDTTHTVDGIRHIPILPPNRMFLHASHISFYRYRKSGANKRFRLGISVPLPTDFIKACADLDIPLNEDDAKGGLFVDLKQIDGHLPDLDGRWLL